MANIQATSDQNFEADVLKSSTPVLVDFWAEWCGPCRALAPKLEEVANEYSGKLKVLKIDIDQNPETPMKFGIRGVPTLIVFKNGQAVDQIVGNVPKEKITETVTKNL